MWPPCPGTAGRTRWLASWPGAQVADASPAGIAGQLLSFLECLDLDAADHIPAEHADRRIPFIPPDRSREPRRADPEQTIAATRARAG